MKLIQANLRATRTKQFSCPCIYDIGGIDKTWDEVKAIRSPINQNDSTSVKLPIPYVALLVRNPDCASSDQYCSRKIGVESIVMVKLKSLLDHMITVQQPETNFEWDFNPGQEFSFNLKLNSATIYCFTFRSREKMAKY